ncbi:MAG: uroporphyrinogen decarboxylase, partial [Alphaproteobacteria bacterium]
MRQAGRYLPEYRRVRKRAGSFLELCYTPALAAEVTLQPVARFGLDAAILFSDILVVADALGVEIAFHDKSGPRLAPVRSVSDLSTLDPAGVDRHLGPVYETVERVARALPEGVALIGFAGAPWTVATYMVEGGTGKDFAKTKLWALDDAEGFQRLLDIVVEATAAHLIAQVTHGAEAVQLFDSWAGALPESAFRRCCITPTRTIVDRFKAAHPEVPVIGFPRGIGARLRNYAAESGVDAVSIDSGVSPAWAAQELQPRLAVQGNLDPVYLLAGGRAMTEAARPILDALGGGPFVFNLGHGVLPDTPPENVALLVETVRAWRP